MNTNSNTYTIIYTTLVCVLVAAILAFVSLSLKSKQDANEKAETISQMLAAAKYYSKAECSQMGNDAVLNAYVENVKKAFTIDGTGAKIRDLDIADSRIFTVPDLKAQDYRIRKGDTFEIPVFIFGKDSCETTVIPVYGAGLWGPVWGYIALESDLSTIVGAYFDHASETPGLGGKIKEEPFQNEFPGRAIDFADPESPFAIVKGGAKAGNEIDAITGATMTSKGLNAAINEWLTAYKPYLTANAKEE